MKLMTFLMKKKKNDFIKIKVNLDLKNILDTLIIDDNIYVSHYTRTKDCAYLEIYYATVSESLNFKTFKVHTI